MLFPTLKVTPEGVALLDSARGLFPDNPPNVTSLKLPNEKPLFVKFSVLNCNAKAFPRTREPPVMLVVPLKLLAPLNISVPLPVLVKLPAVDALAPLMVSTAAAVVTSKVDVFPSVSVKALFVDVVPPVYCKVPPSNTTFEAPLPEAPMLLFAVPFAKLLTLNVP